ncbi:hypothetical protein BDV37DRAFT_288004 [Aspergillus pseudonomiae]|uniref:Uncharacterized protein n=1 Tax=Aspergillus pseudonomiae TaxID=1506151 RepID=A0A5N7CXU4_9EURO|nr:uncharacterized protein BDV37DRAFT_288004 [Aspergillus pseudonomiae]KAE8399010.1 hypothetical protein BDV37DRAFT_288004 [Aspergillus pseudonomiae]
MGKLLSELYNTRSSSKLTLHFSTFHVLAIMAEPSSPKAPDGYKFLEIIIPVFTETNKGLEYLTRIQEHLRTWKARIQRTSPDNPGSYDFIFMACEVEGAQVDEDERAKGKYESLKQIEEMREKGKPQFMFANLRICVKKDVRSDWDKETPLYTSSYPHHGDNEHTQRGELWYNQHFVDCYNAVMSMVVGMIADEEHQVKGTDSEKRRPPPTKNYFFDE